jgi:hypothetical protein
MPQQSSPIPPIGAIAYGESGVGFEVIDYDGECIIVDSPDCELCVPLSAILRWETPVSHEGVEEQRYRLEKLLQATQLMKLTVDIETDSDIVLAGTIGTAVEPLIEGFVWVKFENSLRPCMVRFSELERLE